MKYSKETLMFNKVLIEKDILNTKKTQSILNKVKYQDLIEIDRYDEYFGKYKKPYLQKRENLNLYIAKKKGNLIKETPDAYGLSGDKHYYYIHQYNCIYECEYCYLQGYFHSPDIVLFINHDEIINEMQKIMDQNQERVWFHAGEFSDSLALSHITDEFADYYAFLDKNPNALIELRTKSVNTKALKGARENLYITYSLSPQQKIKEIDLKTPSLKHRLSAINKLYQEGYKIGIHLDPIIYNDDFKENYQEFLDELNTAIPIKEIQYISIGVVRYTPNVWNEVKKNYPNSIMHKEELVKTEGNLIRYNKPMRMWILNTVEEMLYSYEIAKEKVYKCMEI